MNAGIPIVDSAEWAAIGLLAAIGVMLLLILLAFRSRAHRPAPRVFELTRETGPSLPRATDRDGNREAPIRSQ